MKGKKTFTKSEIEELKTLITLRNKSDKSTQKGIRGKIRKVGLYGQDDWGITDMKVSDLNSLIASGRIKVIGGSTPALKPVSVLQKGKASAMPVGENDDVLKILAAFESNLFDPEVHDASLLPHAPGNYIICLKQRSSLPQTDIEPSMKLFAGLPVLYTGIASNSIRQRDYRTHFNGSAGRSTLRKSLGVLFKYSLVPRDSDLATGKTKFCGADEKILTKWMHENLVLFFYATSHYNKLEGILIQHLNPPLNLQGCYAEENRDFRAMLSALRSYKKALSSR